ncbi:hypothetical protein [Hydrogenophaga sp. RWCD_12]|uniref:hypothetical protein n=1 Tax=Hydrogenophaga sp. RWCD_12 TaxID=3391190 RepID=UPI003984EE94
MKPLALVLALTLPFVLAPTAGAQTATTPPPSPRCPSADDLTPADLFGLWQLSLWPEGATEAEPASTGAVMFGPHPEYAGSVRGRLRRSGPGADLEAEVSGDVTDGEFNLDESGDGRTMDAVWTGQPTDCGRTIRGVRRPAEGRDAVGPALQFLLQRSAVRR